MRHLFLLALLITLAGCGTPPKPQPVQPTVMPTYGELVARHNERIRGIDRFWARAVVEIRWVDANGKRRFEQGDGHLILDLPVHSALTLGKLGQTKLWAGSNETHFWLFDELDGKKLYLGRHDGVEEAATAPLAKSPLPVRPVDLPRLLGILPLAPAKAERPVQWIDGAFVIEADGARYHYNPVTYRVVCVELLDDRGQVVLTSRLSNPKRIEAEKAAVGPYLNTVVKVVAPEQEGNMTLFLSEMTDARRRVNPKVFELESLKKIHQPDVVVPITAD